MPFERAEEARSRMGWSPAEMSEYLGVSRAVYRARRQRGRLRGAESVKVEFLELLLEAGARVLEGEAEARVWLLRPARGLGGVRPVDHLTSIKGYEDVRNILMRVEHGSSSKRLF